ncbi:biotin/lipoyl-binding protein, partial [Carboxylicivirga sp. N1Y90]|uniref:biotin/lipoyl-binding protein n=1 Tax=Carboxylicivirga fragile TaxID=3417571 RepID=UPI003D34EB80|nr:biotin/lipoyl-binding protein [Marinilabiliaceae bacterium N1Y90]
MKHLFIVGGLVGITAFFISCSTSGKNDSNDAKKLYVEKRTTEVIVKLVQTNLFTQELHSNGQLSAKEKALIPFKVQEQIIDLKVNNGQRVKKGQVLAQVESFQYKKTLRDCRDQFEKAR